MTKRKMSHLSFSVVLSGGGMRCSWSGGFLVGLEALGLLPKIIVAKSGDTCNAIYLATGQSSLIRKTWAQHLTGTRFIRYCRIFKIVDIDYLFDDIITKKEPLNFVALKTSPMRVYIACFNLTQSKVDYFSNETITPSVLKGSAAIPVLYRKKF